MIKKPKYKSVRKLKKECWVLFSKLRRMEDCQRTTGTLDYGNCITCSKLVRRTEADAGHFIKRNFAATFFDPRNVHLQCKRCNKYGDGETLKYRRAIIALYGEGVDVELEDKATEEKHFTVPELEELKANLKVKIKELEQEG